LCSEFLDIGCWRSRLTPRVGDLLQVTKLLTVFEVYNSEDEAVLSFRKGAAA